MGFISGWMLWFAYTVACSLYALGFAGYFWEIFRKYLPGLTEHLFGAAGTYLPIALVTVVIGAAKEPVFRKILIGEIPQKVARYSPATVLVVKRYVGPFKTFFKRLLG